MSWKLFEFLNVERSILQMEFVRIFVTCYRLEAVYAGCIPIAPNKLVYPELYPREHLYNTPAQLVKMLRNWCRNPSVFDKTRQKFFANFDFQPYSTDVLVPKYLKLLRIENSPRTCKNSKNTTD